MARIATNWRLDSWTHIVKCLDCDNVWDARNEYEKLDTDACALWIKLRDAEGQIEFLKTQHSDLLNVIERQKARIRDIENYCKHGSLGNLAKVHAAERQAWIAETEKILAIYEDTDEFAIIGISQFLRQLMVRIKDREFMRGRAGIVVCDSCGRVFD